MKYKRIALYLSVLALTGLGVALALTNPTKPAYNRYATERLTLYLNDNVCPQAPNILGNNLQDQCVELLKENQADIRKLITQNTEQSNFLFLSLYTTNLSAYDLLPRDIRQFVSPQLLPAYTFETVGVFQSFHTYKARRQ
ncbi:MAG: DUF4359 domain-containing protein [Verrucomicrobia bacterium]|nr:DUF4359 domain-containing protein [Leptolyngbya sp. ES-bin-22]